MSAVPRASYDVDAHGGARAASSEFRALFDGHFGYVCNSLRRLGVREADLADVAQEVFVLVHRKLGDFDPERALRPWLFGIAFRFASAYRRRSRHSVEVSIEDKLELGDLDRALEPLAPDEDVATRDLVLRALGEVHLDRRAVLVMHDIEGHTMEEIAAALEIPLGTGYTRLRSARTDFGDAVDRLQRGVNR